MRILAFNITHDSSVCAVHDGKIEFFCKEERLTKIKRDNHPFKSLELYKQLNLGKVDHVLYLTPSNYEVDIETVYKAYAEKTFDLQVENYSGMLHHKCHASLAFYNSGFTEALVFVIDRNGSVFFINNAGVAREAESVFQCSYPDNIQPLYKSFSLLANEQRHKELIRSEINEHFPGIEVEAHSFGIVKVYEAATTLIGQNPLENGKTMGLSSYGADKHYDPLFINGQPIANYFSELPDYVDQVCFYGERNRIVHEVTRDNYQYYADCAKHVQLETQKAALELISRYVDKTDIKNVCIVGGYGLNVVANYYYLKNRPDINFYFESVADDTGVPVGAALLKYRELTKDQQLAPPTGNFYHYYDASDHLGIGKGANVKDLCELLIKQKSVALFDGAPEVGPRALGHRSILYDPRNQDSKEKINEVKQREWYRPFAGVILESEFHKYFDTAGLQKSECMTVSFDAFEHTKKLVPGIIHVDGTCRIQTVSSGFLFDLLTEFFRMTGCPMLLNTSFNLAGDPLVQTKSDALNVLDKSCLDAVYFVDEEKLVEK